MYVLTPDAHRLGGPVWSVFEATLSCFRTLQHLGVDTGTLNECALNEIPASAKVIYYPIPYQIPDDVYGKLLDWVKAGGRLYVSGDVSYDLFRKRTLGERLNELCGVEFVAERYPNIACDEKTGLPASLDGRELTVNPAIRVRPTTGQVVLAAADAEQTPVLVRNDLGGGRVLFSTWPLERDQGFAEGIPERNARLYGIVLGAAGYDDWPPEDAAGPQLPVSVPLEGKAAHAHVYVNPTDRTVDAWTEHEPLRLSLAPHRSGLAVWGEKSELLAFEDGAGAHYMAYSLDRRDVRDSQQLCLLPLTEGRLRIDARADWSRPVAVVGEVKGGRWVEYERIEAPVKAGSIRLDIDPDRCFSIILVAEESKVNACARRLERSLAEPWGAR